MSGENALRWAAMVAIAAITAMLSLVIGFIAEIRSEQSDMRSRFEERTLTAQGDIARIDAELTRARNTRAKLRELNATQRSRVDALEKSDQRTAELLSELRREISRLSIEQKAIAESQTEQLRSLETQMTRAYEVLRKHIQRGEHRSPRNGGGGFKSIDPKTATFRRPFLQQ